jgi:hypothetical protein
LIGALATGLLLLAAGCGPTWTMNQQVDGVAKLDGKPLANVRIQFVPDVDPKVQAPTSTATTDAEGRFQLNCDNQKPGAVIGKHNVLVFVGRGDSAQANDPDAKPGQAAAGKIPPVPTFYTVAAKTPLQVEVTADKHSYELNLSATAAPRH